MNNKCKKPSTYFECLSCHKANLHNRNNRTNKFCNTKCQHDYLWIKQKKVFAETVSFNSEKNYCEGHVSKLYKKLLIEDRGILCEICKNTEWMGSSIPLVLDHIDGNAGNNNLNNLRLVCGDCDMQLPTYKNKNRGKGRHTRLQRYHDNKSS